MGGQFSRLRSLKTDHPMSNSLKGSTRSTARYGFDGEGVAIGALL